MKRVILLCLLAAAFAARADVMIFNSTSTNRAIGGGQTLTVVGTGRTVMDVDTRTNVTVSWFTLKGRKYYGVDRTQAHVATVTAAGGAKHTVIGYANMGNDTNGLYHVREGYARGQNVAAAIRPTRSINFPTTLALTSRSIQEGPNGPIASEETGVAKFNQAGTQIANAANETVDAVVTRLVGNLRAQGFVEVVIPQ